MNNNTENPAASGTIHKCNNSMHYWMCDELIDQFSIIFAIHFNLAVYLSKIYSTVFRINLFVVSNINCEGASNKTIDSIKNSSNKVIIQPYHARMQYDYGEIRFLTSFVISIDNKVENPSFQ